MMVNKIKILFYTIITMLPFSSLAYVSELQIEKLKMQEDFSGKVNGLYANFVNVGDIDDYLIGEVNPFLRYSISYEEAFTNYLMKHPGLSLDEADEKFNIIVDELIYNGIVIDRENKNEIILASSQNKSILTGK